MRLRKALRKIHRWIGLLASVWLLLLAVTGLLLQHADGLKLTQKPVKSVALLQWFEVVQFQQAWDLDNQRWFQVNNQIKWSDGEPWSVDSPVLDVIKLNHKNAAGLGEYVLVTSDVIYWANVEGELVYALDGLDGVPSAISQVAQVDNFLLIKAANQWYEVTPEASIQPASQSLLTQLKDAHGGSMKPQPRSMSAAEVEQQLPLFQSPSFTYDKVIHGVHSGLKGSVWLNTLSALALLYLCLSGIYLFFKAPKSKRLK